MKRILNFITLLILPLAMYATAQEGDVIYVDGEEWILLGKPLYNDPSLEEALENALPEDRGVSTSNWSGYTAYWSIQNDCLCLDSVHYEIYATPAKTERLASDELNRIFKQYVEGNRIVASWCTGDIRVARGKLIYYVHSEYHRNYEYERIYSIESGKVLGMKDYHNSVKDGFSFNNYHTYYNDMQTELHENFPLHIERYPELADVKQIVFRIKHARVDAQGQLVECEVEMDKSCNIPQLAVDMAEAMKAYYPWRVFYINGEYLSYGIEGYTFKYKIK